MQRISQNRVLAGRSALQKLLSESARDLRGLGIQDFRRWLEEQLAQWQRDPAFRLRMQIRDIRHNCPPLLRLEKEAREVHAAYTQSPQFETIARTERDLENAGKAAHGLEQACAEASEAGKKQALEEKLAAFRSRQDQLRQKLQELTKTSRLRQRLLALSQELEQLRRSLALDSLENQLADLLRQQGRRSGQAGAGFEQQVQAAIRECLVPDLASGMNPDRLRILTGVTLGASRVELDQLLVALPEQHNDPALVLAVIETKRNINDLAHGFRMRQENLAWLTGTTTGFDPELYRNRHFPTGHFDRDCTWQQGQEQFILNRSSFRLFQSDPASGSFLDRLCFATRSGRIWGASSGALSRLQHRVATDHRFEIQSDTCIERLQAWFEDMTSDLETPEVLRLYALEEQRAGQILLLEPR